jgi:hypothetical protein
MGELVQYQNKYYQWVKGDYTGRIETVSDSLDEGGLNFIVFKSGKRINESLILEYMIEVPEHQAIIEDYVEEEIPNIPIEIDEPQIVINSPVNVPVSKNSPVMQLLLSQKKEDDEIIEMELSVKVPKKEMVEILKSSFGDEIEKDLYEYISKQLDIKTIKDSIEEKIKKFITIHYDTNA